MTHLVWAVPTGLMLDVVGFALVIWYGHSLFLHIGPGPPDKETGKDGDLYLGLSSASEEDLAGDRRRLKLAYLGVATVLIGFVLQIIGSTVAILT